MFFGPPGLPSGASKIFFDLKSTKVDMLLSATKKILPPSPPSPPSGPPFGINFSLLKETFPSPPFPAFIFISATSIITINYYHKERIISITKRHNMSLYAK